MTFDLPIDPSEIPTAQHKGVRIVGGVPMFYKKAPLKRLEQRLERMMKDICPSLRVPDGKPAYVHITFLFPYPKSTAKKNRIDLRRMSKRPDGDNLAKAIIDAMGDQFRRDKITRRNILVRRGFFADDGQVNPLVISKFYTTATPRVSITVRESEEIATLT